MSENVDELRSMLITFRVFELQTLLGFAGRNKTGRKNELQQRALELLRVRSHPIHQKIRDIYKTLQQNSESLSPRTVEAMPQPAMAVNPYNLDGRGMYAQNVYNPYPQYAQQKGAAHNNYPIQIDLKFKRLPFFDVSAELLKPSTLVPSSNQRLQEATFFFHLSAVQATDIAQSRDIRPGVKCDYVKQVQLRFCLVETAGEQEDCFPANVVVKVNNKPCPLPNPIPTNKPGVEPKRPPRPVNITPLVKLSPTVTNTIVVQWGADYGRNFALTIALVHKLSSVDLFQRLQTKGTKPSDHTRGMIKDKLKEDADSEITTTCLRVSLICPLGKMRMSSPCRASTCNHLQCFDSLLFLQMNERKPTWCCPVCDKPAVYDNLVIDGYFLDVLSSSDLNEDTSEIQLNNDGSWSTRTEEPPKQPELKPESVDAIEIICDDVEPVSAEGASSSTDKVKKGGVVDLTFSDDDDDEPLSKRKEVNAKPDSTTTPGPPSVSSSGYTSPSVVISLDSPSPPRSPRARPTNGHQNEAASSNSSYQNF